LCPPAPPGEKRFRLWYVGSSCLDRRTTLPMLPWLMAEIRRRGQRQEPGGALGGAVPAREVPAPAVFIFEHKAQHIARFIHNSHDLTYFAYLIKQALARLSNVQRSSFSSLFRVCERWRFDK
uniref:Uncharacterized protein n=1 Tax=Aquila chrysaetos chrysaetos TaxID=223781 RepID=A0A663FB84_AQUCH